MDWDRRLTRAVFSQTVCLHRVHATKINLAQMFLRMNNQSLALRITPPHMVYRDVFQKGAYERGKSR